MPSRVLTWRESARPLEEDISVTILTEGLQIRISQNNLAVFHADFRR